MKNVMGGKVKKSFVGKMITMVLLLAVLMSSTLGCVSRVENDYQVNTVMIEEFDDASYLNAIINEIMERFDGAVWGMDFAFSDSGDIVYSLNRQQYFLPASSLKVFTAGLAFEALGKDFQFHTPVYRTGHIEDGILKGDLVLLASGDLLFGGRVSPDGSINTPQNDHSYGFSPSAVPVSDYPLGSLYELAEQIAAYGIREIEGNIIIDDSLFREGIDDLGGAGGNYHISPSMLNDNIIGILVNPGENVGDPAIIQILPETPYLTVINETITTAASESTGGGVLVAGGGAGVSFENDTLNTDGTRTVTLSGNVQIGSPTLLCTYTVPEPTAFAEAALHMILAEKGITSNIDLTRVHDFIGLSEYYTDENRVAELVSPSLMHQLLPMMKVSSNLHTVAWPYIAGAIVGNDPENALSTGLEMQADMFRRFGVEPSVPVEEMLTMTDMAHILYTPESFTNFLNNVNNTLYFEDFLYTLPIMGVDGTLDDMNPNLTATGNVFAKTGRRLDMVMVDGMRQSTITNTLAGYIKLPDGQYVTFSMFCQHTSNSRNADPLHQAFGEIINAVYEYLAR